MKKILKEIATLEGALLFAGIVVPLIYVTGIWSLSLLSGINFNEVVLYQYHPVRYTFPYLVGFLIKPAVTLSSFLLIVSFPGILFVPLFVKNRLKFGLTRFFSLGFIFNIILLFLGTTLLKALGMTIDRKWFVTVIFTGTAAAFILFFIKGVSFTKYDFSKHLKTFLCIIILLLVISAFIMVFNESVLRPLPLNFDYSEETVLKMSPIEISPRQAEMGVAHHLRTRILPYWLVEYLGKFGVYMWTPPLPYFIDFFNVTLQGNSYASFSLLFLLFTCCIFIFVYKIITIDGSRQRRESLLFYLGPALFMCGFLWLYMLPNRRIDLPPSVCPMHNLFNTLQGLWAFLIMATIFFLFKKDLLFALIFSITASLSRYETIPVIFVLLLINYFYNKDGVFLKRFLKSYSVFAAIFIFYVVTVALSHENGIRYLQGLCFDKFLIRFDWLRNRFNLPTVHQKIWGAGPFRMHNTICFVKLALLTSYFYPGLFLIPTRDKISGLCSIFGIIYFMAVLIQTHQLFSYAGLLIPLAGVNLRRFIYPDTKQQLFNLAAYLIILCLGTYYFIIILNKYNV